MSDGDKRSILVTGCTSGIGKETALYLHEQGYDLLLVGRNRNALETVSGSIKDSRYVVCDLENTDRIQEIFSFCEQNNIMLDGMVHSAGYVINTPIRSFSEKDIMKQMQLHYFAFAELCKGFYKRKISRNGASIVAVSSFASITRDKGSALYSSSKSALNSFVSVAAKEFIKREIRVNAILPAYVDTRLTSGLDELIDIHERQPMGMIPPKHIAYLVEFLLSEKSKYITGAAIPVSGGMEG